MRGWFVAAMLIVVGVVSPAFAQVKITGVQGGSLEALTNSPTLVTVVLKESGARDANLKVRNYNSKAVNFLTPANDIVPYLIADIDYIEVQGGKIEKAELKLEQSRALRPEEQIIYDRAIARAREIYQEANANQDVKIQAATLLALNGEQDAINYLVELAGSNNINAQLSAGLAVYLSGQNVEDKLSLDGLVRKGLESGNRQARSQAAVLAGMTGNTGVTSALLTLLQDRAAAQSAPAAKALARLGVREAAPQLLGMLESRSEQKGEAAQWALIKLGGQDVIEQMRVQLKSAQGFGKLRVAKVLYALGDEAGVKEMQRVYREVFTQAVDAAKVLAAKGDFDAMSYLQGRLNEPMEESDEGRIAYVQMAAALLQGGDLTAQAVMQQVLRSESVAARVEVARSLVKVGNRRLMPLIQSSLESRELQLAIEACLAAVALGNRDFRDRLLASREG
jgi:HEAT repeat protein